MTLLMSILLVQQTIPESAGMYLDIQKKLNGKYVNQFFGRIRSGFWKEKKRGLLVPLYFLPVAGGGGEWH